MDYLDVLCVAWWGLIAAWFVHCLYLTRRGE